MSTERQSVADRIHFSELCGVFQEMKETVRSSKQFIFIKFLRRWREEMVSEGADGFLEYRTDDTFYPALRLFVPSKDTGIREFRIKEAKLNQLVCKAIAVLPLDPVPTVLDLLVERLVSTSTERFPNKQPKLSIADVNDYLERIKYPNTVTVQEQAMEKLCRQCMPNELRWIFHIILGDIEDCLGIHAHTTMRSFHPEADNMWKEGNTLKSICEKLAEEDTTTLGQPTGHLLCKPFRPMLLKRLNYNKYCLPKIIRFCHRPFYVELKYDGEHLLFHRYERINYKYFTRNGVNYTHKMGPTCDLLFSKRIHPFFRQEVRDCVLDCELLIWDKVRQCFVGKSRRASDGNVYDPKHLDDDFFENHTMFERSLAVFDILYLNGKCLISEGLTLRDRMEVLSKIFCDEDRSTIFISKKELIGKAEDFVSFYKNAMSNGEEGIVVKALHSLYKPGSRAERNGWFKCKPDYGIQSVLDLAVVGIRLELTERGEHVKSFLVAARITPRSDDGPQFKMVAGITSRLKALDYQRLRSAIGEREDQLTEKPAWLEFNSERLYNYRFVPLDKLQVVEVRSSGLINGKLQFPAIVAVRLDKPVDEIDTVSDVIHFDQRIRSRPMVDEDDELEASILLNRKKRQEMNLKPSIRLIPARELERAKHRLSDVLSHRKVCVLNASDGHSTQQLQKILAEFGAIPVANPSKDTSFLVAMNKKTLGCVAQIRADRYNIVHGDWLLRSAQAKELFPWTDSDMIHKASHSHFDLFSIHSKRNAQVDERTDESIPETSGDSSPENISRETQELDERDFEGPSRELVEEIFDENTKGKRQEDPEDFSSLSDDAGSVALREKLGNERSNEIESKKIRMEVLLAEEAEQEVRRIGDEIVQQLNGADCQPIEQGNLFADFVFFLHESLCSKQLQIRQQIELQNGRINAALDESVTHVVLGKLQPGEEQPLFDWNDAQQWLGQFVSEKWVSEAIAEGDRYRLPERVHEFIVY